MATAEKKNKPANISIKKQWFFHEIFDFSLSNSCSHIRWKKKCDRRARQNNVFDSWPRVKTFQLYMPRFGEFNQNLPASYCFGS